jgi:hypothetical protein
MYEHLDDDQLLVEIWYSCLTSSDWSKEQLRLLMKALERPELRAAMIRLARGETQTIEPPTVH